MPSRRAVLATCGSVLFAGCAGLGDDPSVSGSWSQRGYDRARTGTAGDALDGPEPPLTAGWTRSLPTHGGGSVSPILADGTLYIGYTDGPRMYAEGERTVVIEALDPGTGDSRWTATVATTREVGVTYYHADSLALAGDGETLLLQSSEGLCAVDTDGTSEWQFDNVGDGQLSHQTVTPGVDAETAYVGRYRQIVADEREPVFYAVDVEDGTERWRHEFSAWDGRLVYSPAVVDGTVYLAEPREGVKALDAADGTELWRESVPVDGAPTVANGTVFVTIQESDGESGACALEAATGEVRWSVTDDPHSGWSPRHLAATDDAIYYAATDRLVARDANTGDRRWSDDDGTPAGEERIGSGTPAVVGNRIYVGGSAVYVIDRADGEVLGRYDVDRRVRNSVAVADGWLYANADGTLYGLETCETEVFGRCLR